MSAALYGALGETLTLERLDDHQIVVLASEPSPPGSMVQIRCEAGSFAIKVSSCRRTSDEGFRIQGRPVNLSRRVREALTVLLA